MKKKSRLLVFIGILVCFLALFVGAGYITGSQVDQFEWNNLEVNTLRDGVYTGQANTLLVIAEVKVEVNDQKLTYVEILKHQHGLGSKAEAITADVIAAQSTQVDSISGATISSRIILKAIDDALSKGK